MTRKILAGITALVFVLSSAAAPGGVAASLLSGPQITASAVSYGDFEYTVSESGAEITAYNGTDAKVQIPETVDGAKVVSIGNYAFNNCTSLESITIPEGVTKIGYGAFNGCKNLSEVVLPDSLITLDNYAFEYCTALTDITLPAGLTTANDAFCNSGLTSATFKDGMTKIPNSIFSDCSEFKSITFPTTVTEIDKYAFNNCTSLESITIPEGVTKIGYGAFNGCKNLSEVVLPDSLTTLDNYAFEYCTALTDITLPAGLTSANDAFCNSGLTSATFKDGMTKIPNSIFSDCSEFKSIAFPETVTEIDKYAFNNCTSLESITIPEGVTKIGYGAFNSCKNLSEVVLPDSLTALDNYAFEYCTALTDITLPAGLTTANYAFYNSGLTSATFKDGMTKIPSGIFSDCSEFKSITFPTTVTEIDDYAFNNCTSLESITIPEGVTKIGYGAFNSCKNLSEVSLPDSLTALDNYAFEYCTALTDITLPAGLTTANDAFYKSGLTSATFKDGMTKIPNDIFYNCSTLKNVTLPEGLTTISQYSFAFCKSLRSIELPDSVTEIGSSAFRGCSSLEYASISNGITKIGDNAFALCSSLKEFTVPASVTEIGGYAFSECTSLEKLFIHKNVRSIGSQAVDPQSETTIYGDAYSVAAEYASANDIPFVATSYDADSANSTYIDLAKSSYASNSSSFSITGYCTFTTEYALRSGVSLPGGAVLTYQIPASAEIDLSTVEIDGKYISNAKYNNSKHLLTVPISKRNGKVAFRVKLIERRNYISTCRFMPSAYSGSDAQIIGTVCMNMDMLTLNCPEKTSLKTLNISGITAAEQEAEIYVDGAPVKTVKASKGGTYKTDITLPDAENYRTYTVTVKTTSEDGSVKRAEKAVTYQDNVCEVTDLTLEYKGKTYSSSEIGSLKPIIVYKPGDKLKLKVKVTNNENVESVTVVNSENGIDTTAEAVWDEKEQAYIAESTFGVSGRPNNFGVVITNKVVQKGSEEIAARIEQFQKQNNIQIDSVKKEQSNGYTLISYNAYTSNNLSKNNILLGYKKENGTNGITRNNYQRHGYTQIGGDTFVNTINEKIIGSGKDFVVTKIIDLSDNTIISTFSNVDLADIKSNYDFFNSILGFSDNYFMTKRYFNAINNSGLSQSEKARLNEQTIDVFGLNCINFLLTSTAFFIPEAAAFLGPICFASDLYLEYLKNELERNIKEGRIPDEPRIWSDLENWFDELLHPDWIVDPSGIVYDADSKKPIYGATVTIYYKEDLGDKNAALWDAAEYDQQNPITTDEDGFYAWDVPAGYWQVKAECDGYETSYSDWLPVPPPQLEVNIPLKKINVPHVHTRSGWIIDKQPKVGVKGSKHIECTECGEILETAEIPALGAADITSAKVTLAGSSLEFTGKTQKPSPTVTLNGKKLKNGTDYTVSYKNNKAIGKAYVIVKGKNNYTGTIKKSFNIVPQKQVIVKLSAQAKAFSVKWTLNKNVTGYQIKYSTASNFSGGKSVYIKKNTSAKKTLTSLKSKKTYYVKVRSYKTVNGVKYYGAWSNAKKIRTK